MVVHWLRRPVQIGYAPSRLRRYHFHTRLLLLVGAVLIMAVVQAAAGIDWRLLAGDGLVVVLVAWRVWREREPIFFLLAWRSATHGAGMGHWYKTTNKHGQAIEKVALPQVRRLWRGPGVIRVNVLPVLGKSVEFERQLDNLTAILGMSHAEILDRRPGLRSMRYVVEFRRSVTMPVQAVEQPPLRAQARR